MDELSCFKCQENIPNGLDGLRNHFINQHGLTINRRLGNRGFICSQNGCQRSFTYFFALRRHIRKFHTFERQIYQEREQYQPVIAVNFLEEGHNHVNNNNEDIDNNIENNAYNEINDEFEEEFIFDLKMFITRMIANLQCNGSLNGSIITSIIDQMEQFSFYLPDFMKFNVYKYLKNQELLGNNQITEVMKLFDFENPFCGLRTLDEQIDALRANCGYIDAEEIPLGYRVDTVLDSETCTYVPKMIMETFQYVPVIRVLSQVLSNDKVRDAILNEKKSPDGMKSKFIDGDHCKVHPLFSRFPQALRLKIYYDELEILNPLGSKTSVHKLWAFYFVIDNLPRHMNSEVSDIHVLLICCYADIQKYGFEKILAPFISDLEKLESDQGVEINIKGEKFVLHASISGFCEDGLAVHQVFNHLGPSAKYFCRMCLYSRRNLHAGSVDFAEERNENLHQRHLASLERNNFSADSMKETGLKGECPLNLSRYFHTTRNKIFDIFHDILQGLAPMVMKLVLHELVIVKKRFNLEFFNGRIASFNYGYVERKNKPSSNFTENSLQRKENSLSQKGLQMWLLLRVFPFLISSKIKVEDECVDLILYLLRIMEIVFAPNIHESVIPYLRSLTKDFF